MKFLLVCCKHFNTTFFKLIKILLFLFYFSLGFNMAFAVYYFEIAWRNLPLFTLVIKEGRLITSDVTQRNFLFENERASQRTVPTVSRTIWQNVRLDDVVYVSVNPSDVRRRERKMKHIALLLNSRKLMRKHFLFISFDYFFESYY